MTSENDQVKLKNEARQKYVKRVAMPDQPIPLPDPTERRSEPRYLCDGEATIIDTATGLELGEGILSDISPSGASLHVYCPVDPGAVIELRQGQHIYHGQVRYCIPSGADFRLGLQLIPPEQWTPDKRWPVLRKS